MVESKADTSGFTQLTLPAKAAELKVELIDEDLPPLEDLEPKNQDDFLDTLLRLRKMMSSRV